MKKIYVTQYLPVEGKLRKGQRCVAGLSLTTKPLICQYLGEDTFKSLTLNPPQDIVLPDWEGRFNFTPYDLFLCDRDLRPVGLVSPEAVWVTEDMELSELEVKQGWLDVSTQKILPNHWAKAIAKNNRDVKVMFQILCSNCKTFH